MSRTNQEWHSLIQEKVKQVRLSSPEASYSPASGLTHPDATFALTIDHTLLKPEATPAQIDQLCDDAIEHGFKSCCVNGTNIKQVAQRLEGRIPIPCAVIGFPLGASKTSVKVFEAQTAVQDGAKEIDMVINVGALKAGEYSQVFEDIAAVVQTSGDSLVKVIIETVLLSDDEKVAASFIASEAGAQFVKTSTGFLGGGATSADISLMKKTVKYKPDVKVKASGGIRSFEKCLEMFRAGADRIGSSSMAGVMTNVRASAEGY